eukprot:30765-Amphidinium_carterae.1
MDICNLQPTAVNKTSNDLHQTKQFRQHQQRQRGQRHERQQSAAAVPEQYSDSASGPTKATNNNHKTTNSADNQQQLRTADHQPSCNDDDST